MLLPRTTSSGSFQKRSPSREVQITSRRQMFIQLSQLTRWPLYVSPFLSSTSIGCPCDVRRSESGSTIPPPDSPSSVLSLCAAESSWGVKKSQKRLSQISREVCTEGGLRWCTRASFVPPRRALERNGATITATIISTTGAATGRLGGRTVRGCRGCGGLVLGVCTPGEVKERQRLESGRRLL